MFVELLLKKNGKILFAVFLLLFFVTVIIGTMFVINSINTSVKTFDKDGYALFLDDTKNVKAEAYSFKSGTEYKYKKTTVIIALAAVTVLILFITVTI